MTIPTNRQEMDHLPALDDCPLPRRQVLTALGVGAAALATGGAALGQDRTRTTTGMAGASAHDIGWDPKTGRYVLPALPYPYDALEPAIDELTMRLHHDKHHAGYVRGLNAALDALTEIRAGSRDASEVKHWSRQLAFNGSGHLLHTTFWFCMKSDGGRPSGMTARMIERDFGGYDNFAKQFTAAASSVEGSGWGLLVFEPLSRRLLVMQAEKHQNLTMWGVVPLVVLDVWEHAYYLHYQNNRKTYVNNFMNIINWDYPESKIQALTASLGG